MDINERKKVFASRFTEALKKNKMSAAKLSKITGVSEGVISQYKSGKYEPKRDRIELFSKILRVSPAWLSGYNEGFENMPDEDSINRNNQAEKLRFLRENSKMSIGEVADYLGVHANLITRWENGLDIGETPSNVIFKMKQLYKTSIRYLIFDFDDPSTNADELFYEGGASDHATAILSIVKTVKRGQNYLLYDDFCGRISTDKQDCKNYFYFKVQDDGLSPMIQNGDAVLIRKTKAFSSGDIVLVVFGNDNGVLRKVVTMNDTTFFQPLNPIYDTVVVSESCPVDYLIAGVAVSSLHETVLKNGE